MPEKIDPNSPEFAQALTKAFREATREAVREAHAAGLPVAGADKDGPYYLKPDGIRVPLAPGDEGVRQYQQALDVAAKLKAG